MYRLTAMITGASAGIGSAFAQVFAENGFNLVLVARRAERLEQLAETLRTQYQVEVTCLPADLAKVGAVKKLMSELESQDLTIDVLVNNAGLGLDGGFLDNSWDAHRAMHQVMLIGYTELCYRLLPSMVERQYGRIINVSSVAALLPSPAGSLYTGIKKYIIDLSLAIDFEFRDKGIQCLALCPGFTYTEFHDVMGVREQASNNYPPFMWQSADEVAREGFEAVMSGKVVVVNGLFNRILTSAIGILPRPLQHWIARRQTPFEE